MEKATIDISLIKSASSHRGTDAELSVLIDSMRTLGQLQEIVLNSRYEMIAGRRRLAAAKRLGWKSLRAFISPTFDDAIKALRAERDENCPGCRVALTRAEQLELARRLEEIENPEAAKRKAATQAKKGEGKVGGKQNEERSKTRDKIGEAVGMSGRTLEKAQAVIDEAQQYPERYIDLAEQVSQDNQPIDPVYQEFKKRQEIFEAAERDSRFAPVAEKLTTHHDTDTAYSEFSRLRDEQGKDKLGRTLPRHLAKVFNDPWIGQCVAELNDAEQKIKVVGKAIGRHHAWPHLPAGVSSAADELMSLIEFVRDGLEAATPYAVCEKCGGEACKGCKMAGWVPEKTR